MLLHDAVRDGVGQAERQQRGLPAAGRTIPDLLIHMNGQVFLCDVTVADTLADSNLATAATGPARLAKEAARGKVDKYKLAADAMRAVQPAVRCRDDGRAERVGAAADTTDTPLGR